MNIYLSSKPDSSKVKFNSVKTLLAFLKECSGAITVIIEDRIIDENPLIIDEEVTSYLSSLRIISGCGSFFCAEKLNVTVENGYTYANFKGDCRSFFAGSTKLKLSSYPEQGYFNIKKPYTNKFSGFFGESTDIIDKNTLLTVWPGGDGGTENWHTITTQLKNYDEVSGFYEMEVPSPLLELGRGSRYKLENVKNPKNGEFYFEKEDKKVVICGDYTEVYGVAECCPVVIKNNACPVTFEGIEFYGSNSDEVIHGEFGQKNAMIHLQDTKDVTVINCYVHDVGGHAISIYGNNENVTIENNVFKRLGHSGVAVVGYDGSYYNNFGHKIIGNRIEKVGLSVGHAAGVSVVKAKNIDIKNNTIIDSPRYAISIKGYVSSYLKDGKLVSSDDIANKENNINIVSNDVSRCNLDSQDTGVIEGYHAKNVNISDNYVHDSNIPFSFGTGIYLDDECENVLVSGNLLENLSYLPNARLSNAITVKGVNNQIINNKIFNCNIEPNGGHLNVMHLGSGKTYGTKISSNAFLNSRETFLACSNWTDDRINFCNFNFFDSTPVLKGVFHSLAKTDVSAWQKKGGFDTLSVFGGKFEEYSSILGITAYDKYNVGCSVGEFDKAENVMILADGKGVPFVLAKKGEKISLELCEIDARGVKRIISADFEAQGMNLCGNTLECNESGMFTVTSKKGDLCAKMGVFVGVDNPKLGAIVSSYQSVSGKGIDVLPYLDYGVYKSYTEVSFECKNCSVKNDGKILKVEVGVGACELLLSCGDQEYLIKLNGLKDVLDNLEVSDIFTRVNEKVKIPYIATDENGLYKQVKLKLDGKDCDGEIYLDEEGVKDRILTATDGIVTISKGFKTLACKEYTGNGKFINVGGCQGIVGEKDGKTLIASNGSNVWFDSDDVSFLYESVEGDFEITLKVDEFYCPNKNTQCGILIKASEKVSAEVFNFRINDDGNYMVAVREKAGGEVKGAYSTLPILSPTLMVKRNGQSLTAYINGDEFYTLTGVDKKELLVGFGLFSGDRKQSAYAVIERMELVKK